MNCRQLSNLMLDVHKASRFIKQVVFLSWSEFRNMLTDINKKSHAYRKNFDGYFLFSVQPGTEDSVFWRTKIRLVCHRIKSSNNQLMANKLMDLQDFIGFYSYLKILIEQQESLDQIVEDAEECLPSTSAFITAEDSAHINDNLEKRNDECCICLERRKEVALSCFHGFCLICISQWSEYRSYCPICRTEIPDIDDVWIMSGFPDKGEMAESISSCMNAINLQEQTDDSR